MERKPITHITAGLLIAVIIVLFAIITNFLGMTQQKGLGMIQYILIIGGLIYFISQYGKANNYHKSFGDLFAFGFKTTAVYTCIFLVFIILFFALFPEIKEKSLQLAKEQMEASGKVTDDQIDKAMQISRKFFWVGLVGLTAFFLVIVGAIGSLLGAAVTKKEPINPLDQLNA
ncbi:MAG TPA: DUF4199 domain-containing protein [Flavisolibacter sp.]|jgi:hypothetical protein|nr:DUF4199 domain-containing protein [Flavisolibacter sp.]